MQSDDEFTQLMKEIKNGNFEGFRTFYKDEYLNGADRTSRPIHYACEFSNLDVLRYLLDRKCDIEAEDHEELRPIHIASDAGNIDVLLLLIANDCNLEATNPNKWRPIHFAASNGHVDVLRLLMKYNCDMEAETKDGLRLMHFASYKGDKIMIRFLLDNGCDMEAVDAVGFKPLHYAAYNGYVSILRILVDNNCDLDWKSKSQHTAFGMARLREMKNSANLLQRISNERKQMITNEKVLKSGDAKLVSNILDRFCLTTLIDFETSTTIFDLLFHRNDRKIFTVLREKVVRKEEIDDWIKKQPKLLYLPSYRMIQECLLYRCIRYENESGFELLCTAELVNSATLFMGPSVLETVAEYNRVIFLDIVLRRLIMVDELWIRSIDIAQSKGYNRIASIIANRKHYLELQYKDGYNRLHIAVFDNEPGIVQYILDNQYLEADEGAKTVGSALSHAYIRKVTDCIRKFEEKKVNVNTVNKKKHSALDVAIRHGMAHYSDYLIDNLDDVNLTDYMGLTMLEKAVIAGCEGVCEKLVEKGASFDGKIHIKPQWLNVDPDMTLVISRPCPKRVTREDTIITLCLKLNGSIYPCFLNTLGPASINKRDGESNTLLHISASFLLPHVCSELLARGASVDVVNAKGYTPLMEMLESHECLYEVQKREDDLIKTAEVLLDHKASINIEGGDGHNLLEIATNCGSERLLLTLVRGDKPIEHLQEPQLVAWFQYRFLELLRQTIDRIKITLLQKWITFEVINCSMSVADMTLTMLLVDRADPTVTSKIIEKVLYKASQLKDEALFKRLLNTDISNVNLLVGGDSLLHALIKEKNIKYCQIILLSKNVTFMVEKQNVEKKLPIHVCIENDVQELMDTLIIETKGVNHEDGLGYTPLALLLEKLSNLTDASDVARTILHIKMLINKSADIYAINKFNRMIISFCQDPHLKAEVETFYNNQKPPSSPLGETEEMICKICMNNRVDCVFECGHVFCMECGQKVFPCPMCRHEPTKPKRMLMG